MGAKCARERTGCLQPFGRRSRWSEDGSPSSAHAIGATPEARYEESANARFERTLLFSFLMSRLYQRTLLTDKLHYGLAHGTTRSATALATAAHEPSLRPFVLIRRIVTHSGTVIFR